jgi:hypothetical protein
MKIQVTITYSVSDERNLEMEGNRVYNVLTRSAIFPEGRYSKRDLSALTVVAVKVPTKPSPN